MKKSLLLFLSVICFVSTKAQYVTIPDANFVIWLTAHVPSAMSSNQMDTTNLAIITTTYVNAGGANIANLSGIRYFDALITLYCGVNNLTSLPVLPASTKTLNCEYNSLTSLPTNLPNGLINLSCTGNKLTTLPTTLPNSLTDLTCPYNLLTTLPSLLPSSLNFLSCSSNQLTSLPSLPNSLTSLQCGYNQLSSLPTLPTGLLWLNAEVCKLSTLPTLPNTLLTLSCYNNSITALPIVLPPSLIELSIANNLLANLPSSLPSSLIKLSCSYNQISILPTLPSNLQNLLCSNNLPLTLPTLPSTLKILYCDGLQLTSLPSTLPNSLTELSCSHNQLISLPATIPNSLTTLNCSSNQLTSLPALPSSLSGLNCGSNQLTSLLALPNSITMLNCSHNQLSTLSTLPSALFQFYCNNNFINCFPTFPNSLNYGNYFDISNNPFTCLPNYVLAMGSNILAYPICDAGNINGCSGNGIFGFAYRDNDGNCLKNMADSLLKNIPIKIYDNSGVLLDQTSTFVFGAYEFSQTAATYSVVIDTNQVPFTAQCPYPGIDTSINVTNIVTNLNFALTCKSGFDIGVQSVRVNGWVFPGQTHHLHINAGDVSHWYHLNCANGVSGQVQVTVTGNVSYIYPAIGTLTPSISGNVYTFNVTDFGMLNNESAFDLVFNTIPTAQVGDTICVTVSVTPAVGDNYLGNNTFNYCYLVVNSHDPNKKESYPIDVAPGYQDWFTYTIHFQNTGNAPAFNINLIDTISDKLDLNTFQIIDYSHKNTFHFKQNVLCFNFPTINLPDSSSNSTGSQGFVQYRIKPKTIYPNGTQIKNTAYIYFDFNSPIITNTTVNHFGTFSTASINEVQPDNLLIYPNPSRNFIFISDIEEIKNVQIYNTLGELIILQHSNSKQENIDISNLNKGIYFVEIKTNSKIYIRKIIKE